MNERIKELYKEAVNSASAELHEWNKNWQPGKHTNFEYEKVLYKKFAELIVQECAGLIHLECEDFANGNCFHDDALWESVTTEYGKNKERGFDPIGMSIHFDKLLKKHFGVEE